MTKIDSLLKAYQKHIKIPWREDASPMERVWFCVYDENDELLLRSKIEEFELATIQNNHQWELYDLTDSFANWLSKEKYAESYFKNPKLLNTILPRYASFLTAEINKFIGSQNIDDNTVFAIHGVGSLFGLLKVKNFVERIAPLVKGRLLIFFPGSYEDNNYRLLDGYDGWNYLAVPILSDYDE